MLIMLIIFCYFLKKISLRLSDSTHYKYVALHFLIYKTKKHVNTCFLEQ